MDKDEIRKQAIAGRKELTKEYKEQASKEIFDKVKELLPDDSRIFVYVAMADEVQTDLFMEEYPSFAVPKCYSGGRMEAVTGFSVLEKTSFGTMEPIDGNVTEDIDAAIIPGLAFSCSMDRIGYGAGCYDRFLDKHPDIKKIAVCFDVQIRDDFIADEHDVKMDYIVTEKQVITGEQKI